MEILINGNGYRGYLFQKIGEKKAAKAMGFDRYLSRERACEAAEQLRNEYDLGVALATDGLYLGYIFEAYSSFPIVAVDMKRKGLGATWKPIDAVNAQEKRVLVLDNDVVTGRTVKRAVRELLKSGAKYVDLLLVYGHTEMSTEFYQKIKNLLSKEVRFLGYDWGDMCFDTMCQIPKGPSGFRKVMSLEEDF